MAYARPYHIPPKHYLYIIFAFVLIFLTNIGIFMAFAQHLCNILNVV